MPYRLDLETPASDALDRLVDLGALDVDLVRGHVAAILPDEVSVQTVVDAIGATGVRVSAVRGRDAGSVWILVPRPVQVGRTVIVPAGWPRPVDGLRMIDGEAFGTGLHPTTALCLEILDDEVGDAPPACVLDVGTGSGVLALAALRLGVLCATAIDVDHTAIRAAAVNARLNGLAAHLQLVEGGPESLTGAWPLAFANILAAPLMDMAPALIRRLAHYGTLVLSGIASSVAGEVEQVYRRAGMRPVRREDRHGWAALVLQAGW
ncbi:MAG: 50S ribosomal protein L11 methyltransferase [Acidobacteria bacterium]|nr:50S ribosomal protein L11 methyltransferase [Acidobacteriota bacterium]